MAFTTLQSLVSVLLIPPSTAPAEFVDMFKKIYPPEKQSISLLVKLLELKVHWRSFYLSIEGELGRSQAVHSKMVFHMTRKATSCTLKRVWCAQKPLTASCLIKENLLIESFCNFAQVANVANKRSRKISVILGGTEWTHKRVLVHGIAPNGLISARTDVLERGAGYHVVGARNWRVAICRVSTCF